MSGTISATNGTSGSTSATSSTSATALTSLTSNFNDFLNLLMTQIQNQDPTNPTDTNQFTTELVQFTGVSQQITTNSDLNQLIQLTQGNAMLQASSMVGKQVLLNSSTLPLQGGSAAISYTAPVAEPVTITVKDASGNVVRTATVQASAGANNWSWNGTSDSGVTMPDGAYTVSAAGSSSSASVAVETKGAVTGVVQQGGTLDLQMGTTSLPFSDVAQVL